MNTAQEIWKKTLAVMGEQMTSTTIRTWFNDVYAVAMDGDTLVLCSPDDFKRDIITQRYLPDVEKALGELFSQSLTVRLVDEEGAKRLQSDEGKRPFMPGTQEYTFDKFVVGSTNRFAYNAAKKVSENPGMSYNPLFIYGASGLGKTHLLYAIAQAIHQDHPDWRILYVKSETFYNELIETLRSQEKYMDVFRKKYRDVDVFLMDDVQSIAGKNASMEELFHTFNTLYETKKQIVFTSDRQPQDINRLDERLKTRFDWGLTVDIQPPDYETRVAITKNKAIARGIDLPDPVLQYVAENITANVRLIEGTVSKIVAMQELMGEQINVDNVIRAVRDMLSSKNEYFPSPELIIREVAQYYNLEADVIKGENQSKSVSAARNVAIYLIRNMSGINLQEIGAVFNRHHSTIISSIKRVEGLIKTDPEMEEILRDLKSNINGKFE